MMPPTSTLFGQLGISLLLGLLVGLQREHAAATTGLRTFPLITVLGTVAALLALKFQSGGWIVAMGFIAVVAVLAVARSAKLKQEDYSHGSTTDVAVLVMYGVGALLVVGPMAVAIAIGGGVAVLLQFKPELHGFAQRLGDKDLRGIMQFVLITCIILPVLPNNPIFSSETYGPLAVLNPFQIWLMVVLIVGMSLGGYITYKFLGHNAGILLGGLLGGAISSTATTVSYSRQARGSLIGPSTAAVVILIASTMVFARVLIEIAVVAPGFLHCAAPPICVLAALTALPSLAVWYRMRHTPAPMPEQDNPTQLKSAVFFGVMYALVLLALAAAKEYTSHEYLYAVAGLSGLTDMDAITLSTATMVRNGELIEGDAMRMIVVASLANLVFKAGIVGLMANRRLLAQIVLLFSVPLTGGLLLLLF
ncbi:MAG: MgtC/SapB family protein [Pirellulales bacterium]|nr:MgtC/SapB family protein [Pirellulales bacterium]